MQPRHYSIYERFAPFLARLIFGGQFLLGAAFKLPGTSGFTAEAGMTAAKGLPFATGFVGIAFVLEVVCALCLILGYRARPAALVLAVFTLSLAIIFYTSNLSDPMIFGAFISHLGLIAGLLFVSVYGAKTFAIKKDA